MKSFLLSLYICISLLAMHKAKSVYCVGQYKFSTNFKCGMYHGQGDNAYCPAHKYCSKYGRCCDNWNKQKEGWCALGSSLQEGQSLFDGDNVPAVCRQCDRFPLTTDNRCGREVGRWCYPTQTCSIVGWCGVGPAYKNRHSNTFDGFKVPGACVPQPNRKVEKKEEKKEVAPAPKVNCSDYKLSKNMKCGSGGGNTYCPSWASCSKWSWCGVGSAYVNGGQSQYNGDKVPSDCRVDCNAYPLSTNHRCGSYGDNKYCKAHETCSTWGWCGEATSYGYGYNENFSGHNKYSGYNVPKVCRDKQFLKAENSKSDVHLLDLNGGYKGKSGYSGSTLLFGFIIAVFIGFLVYYKRKNSKSGQIDERYEGAQLISGN